jgi:hypothetical protein
VLTIEYKVNFLSPAQGERMLARGRVVRPGRTVTVCSGDVVAIVGGSEKVVATMLATMATVSRQEPGAVQSRTSIGRVPTHAVGSRDLHASVRNRWCVCQGVRRRLGNLAAPR